MPHVYKITSPKNKIYIGSTVNINNRFNSYKRLDCKSQIRLYRSFLKYGVDKHKFEIITECTIEDMYKLENYYGNLYNCLHTFFGLNCVLPKAGTKFNSRTEETKIKISINMKGRIVSEETKQKLRIINTGKISNMKGINYHKKESKKKMSISHTGKKLSEETKNKISISHKNRIPKNHSQIIKIRKKIILFIDYGIFFNSLTECSIFFGKSIALISMIVNKKRKHSLNLVYA